MASTDARPIPLYNTAYRVYFPIWKTDGTLLSATWTSPSATVVQDGTSGAANGTPTQVSGTAIGYLDLLNTEMDTDCSVVVISVTNTGAMPQVITLYPENTGDINVDVTAFGGTAGTFTGGRPEVNSSHISGSSTAADKLEASAAGIVALTASGTHSNTTTQVATGADPTNDHYNGRTIVFTSGTLAGEAVRITDYNGSTLTFTHTALANSEAASNSDTFVVV